MRHLVFLLLFVCASPFQVAAQSLDKDYYKGIELYHAEEYSDALPLFTRVRLANIPVMSASAAFYEGVIQYGLENYDDAKKVFEWVLDNSKDPELDKKADEYLEAVFQAIQNKKLMEKKWKIVASLGLNYDSNILFSPDNDSASAVVENDGGGRGLMQGEIQRKLSHKSDSDWSAKLDSLYMYSFDSAFNRADPWLTGAGFVYNKRGETVRKSSYQYSLEPRGEILYMDADDEGTREKILSSAIINNDFTVVKRDDYLVSYGIDLRLDNSSLSTSTGDNNSDAFKYVLSNTHTMFIDKTKKRAFIGKIKYAANDAKGKNKSFNRITLSTTYAAPAKRWQNTVWTIGLSAFKLRYPQSDTRRRDTNMTIDYSISKTKNENWSYTGVLSYSSNTSSVDTSQYTRYSALGLATYTWTD